jgi:hypothetical protein
MVSQALTLEMQVMPGFRVGHHFFYNEWSVVSGQLFMTDEPASFTGKAQPH